jgi:alginate O-acetyltransferase complex protein AlgI
LLFNSWEFVGLVVATAIIYYFTLLMKYQVVILIVASFVFYAYQNPILLVLLLFSILFYALFSRAVYSGSRFRHVFLLSIGISVALAVLAFFKYGGLIYRTFTINNDIDVDSWGRLILMAPLPIGISFFTFEGISLMIDSFQTRLKSELPGKLILEENGLAHLKKTALFISFFPHLVAGPIIKATQFYPQIVKKELKEINWEYVFKTLTLGFFLKMVIADNIKDQTYWISYPYFQSLSSLTLAALLFGYSIQIFSDFAGYSLIALGIAAIFGYILPVNFNYPYISKSFSEFWTRWHISLSSWLREYLYIPLGGNRKRTFRTYLNIMIVMGLGGLWHGAAWSYAIWGAWHGLLLITERMFKRVVPIPVENVILKFGRTIGVFTMVTLAWLLFKLPDFHHVIIYIQKMYVNTRIATNWSLIEYIFLYSLPVIIYHMFALMKSDVRVKVIAEFGYLIFGLMLFLILFNSGTPNVFIYFQF